MNRPLNEDAMARALADAMHAEVDAAVPPPALLDGLRVRATLRHRARVTAIGVAASLAVVAGAVAVEFPDPSPTPPAGMPTATRSPAPSPSPEPPIVPTPRMEAASLPPGFKYWNTEHALTNPGRSGKWPLVVTYARGFTDAGKPRTPIMVTTSVDAITEVDPQHFEDAEARWVVVGSRRVVRAGGGYHWTEDRGVNVSVTAHRGVSDEELRRVVADVRLVSPRASSSPIPRLEPLGHTGVLYAETRGRGSRTIGPIAVPAEFDVTTACAGGGRLRIEIGSLRESTDTCDDPDTPFTHIVGDTDGVRSVTITLTAERSTSWAILVTTSDGHP